ncbi:hypothetical protein QQX09_02025 [Demequina sp. SYSU T00192]|uniref:non-specific serine/threonine protein kinase n=1 Tax=Demequina litoralis TaxID=3051660 RepID=A0ABT8G650_9MICO|nr:hypothetical protein [Demequina sp. SYSU T00192]MDN4474625.1 hypothetical protein [Demequina sp. SYSU T00192]
MRRITPLQLDRVTRAVGRGDADERAARARVAALSTIEHPGVCVPLDVVREDDAVVVCSPRVAGTPLAEAGRTADLGAWVWLVAGLAEALAALHARGLAHGDVAPGNVVVGTRPVLVDLVGPALGRERGTPGFAAPERAAGGAPSAPGDVHALGAVALAAAGPELRTEAEAWMAPLLDPDPDVRPSAGAVGRGILGCAAPVRWRPAAATDGSAVAPAARTVTDPRAWHWRLRRRPLRLVAVAALAVGAAGWAVWGPPLGEPTSSAGAERAVPAAASSLPDPGAAARALTGERVDAVAAGDGEALVALTVPGSAAWATAAREARLLEDVELRGLTVGVGPATIVETGGGTAVVEVAYGLSAHVRAGPGGARTEVPAERQEVRLALEWSGERWRVVEVSAAP